MNESLLSNSAVQSMLIHSSTWNGQETFRLIPLHIDCPYNEVMYDPENKVLAIVSKDKKVKPQFMPKLNEKGEGVVKKINKDQVDFVQQRVMMEMYYEYYIEKEEDIISFINTMAINPDHTTYRRLIIEKTLSDTQ